jgi:hypothetical protein
MRSCVRIDLGQQVLPDRATICRFGDPPARRILAKLHLVPVDAYLPWSSIKISRGTIARATIIVVRSSHENAGGECDSGMRWIAMGRKS